MSAEVLEAASHEEAAARWILPAAQEVQRETELCGLGRGFNAASWDDTSEAERRKGWDRLFEHSRAALGAAGPAALADEGRWELSAAVTRAHAHHESCQQRSAEPTRAEWQLEKIGRAYKQRIQETAECYSYGSEPPEE